METLVQQHQLLKVQSLTYIGKDRGTRRRRRNSNHNRYLLKVRAKQGGVFWGG